MVFSSLSFLFYFLPLSVAAYFAAPQRLRNSVLLAASLIFYTWGGGALVALLFISIVADYLFGWLVGWAHEHEQRRWKIFGVAGSVIVNVTLLGYFKYANFLVEQLNALGHRFGWGEIAWTSVVLPIGISFFTFQSMSYTIDIARGRVHYLKNPIDFALYVALFPQLIAGPIVRYREIADQIRERHTRLEDFAQGAIRFVHGLAKKVIVADAVGEMAETAFALPAGELTSASAWLGVLAYTLQIYFDFSGYSDMAIGLGSIFGFRFPENFNRPYSAVSITDFWRRWHMTLSNWFRDFVYIPLGGSRRSRGRMFFNLVFVFLICGLWHGANWTFVVWGTFHGVLLIVERLTHQRALDGAPWVPLRRATTLALVILGWVIFRADSLAHAAAFYRAMLSFDGLGLAAELALAATHRNLLIFATASTVVLLPGSFSGAFMNTRGAGLAPAMARAVLLLFGLPYAALLVASGSFSPFLYFQF